MTGLERLLRLHSMRGGITTQEATATGNPATFETTLVRPLVKCEAAFMVQQSGTGNPSPENVRPFTGWTGLTVNVSPTASGGTEYPVNWQTEAGTVYGGYVDLVSGKLTATHKQAVLSDPTLWKDAKNSSYKDTLVLYYGYQYSDRKKYNSSFDGVISSYGSIGYTGNAIKFRWFSTSSNIIGISVLGSYTLESVQIDAALGKIEICYELATPIIHQLSPQTIRTLSGENNIWSDANGDMTVTYKKKG